MNPSTNKDPNLVLDGTRYRQSHKASVISILGDRAPEVYSRGSKFFNQDLWTLRVLTTFICKWAHKNPGCIPVRADVEKWVKDVNGTPVPQRAIVIAATPDKLPVRMACALTGGGYHEAFHTYYSCRRPLTVDEVASLVLPRWALLRDWSKYHDAIQKWSNIIEDIRIERVGQKQFEGTYIPLCDLQDFILNQEAQGDSEGQAEGAVLGALSIIVRVFRDVGLGYNTTSQQEALRKYRVANPDAVRIVLEGPLAPILKEAISLSSTDSVGCLRLAFDVIIKLAELGEETDEQDQPKQDGPGDGEHKCPKCGASAGKLKVRPKSDGMGGKVKGKGVVTCTVCGWQDEIDIEKKKAPAEGQPSSGESPQFEGFDEDDLPDGSEGKSGDKSGDNKDGKKEDGKSKKDKPEKGGGSGDKEKSDSGSTGDTDSDGSGGDTPDVGADDDGDGDDGSGAGGGSGGDSDSGKKGKGKSSSDSDEDSDLADKKNKSKKVKSDGSDDGSEEDGAGTDDKQDGDGAGSGSGKGGKHSGEGDEGDSGEGGDSDAEGDEDRVDGDQDGQEDEGDGQGTGQGSGEESDGKPAKGAGGHKYDPNPHKGNEDWGDLITEVLNTPASEVNLLDNNTALSEGISEVVAHNEAKLQPGEAPWKPYNPGLDSAALVVNSIKGRPHDAEVAEKIVKSVKSESAYLRARLQTIVRSLEMTNTYHGVPKGRGLSQRYLVDSHVTLKAGYQPQKAYYRKGQQLDMSMACVTVLDESGSMSGILKDASRILVALTEPFDALNCATMAIGFRDGQSEPYSPKQPPTEGCPCHRFEGVRYDLFKMWHERFNTVKWRFANTRAEGGTPMADGIQYALKALDQREEAHRFLFVVTDGCPNSGHASIMKYQMRIAKEAGIHIVGIGLGKGASSVKSLFEDYIWVPDQQSIQVESMDSTGRIVKETQTVSGVSLVPKLLVAKLNELVDQQSGRRGKPLRGI